MHTLCAEVHSMNQGYKIKLTAKSSIPSIFRPNWVFFVNRSYRQTVHTNLPQSSTARRGKVTPFTGKTQPPQSTKYPPSKSHSRLGANCWETLKINSQTSWVHHLFWPRSEALTSKKRDGFCSGIWAVDFDKYRKEVKMSVSLIRSSRNVFACHVWRHPTLFVSGVVFHSCKI